MKRLIVLLLVVGCNSQKHQAREVFDAVDKAAQAVESSADLTEFLANHSTFKFELRRAEHDVKTPLENKVLEEYQLARDGFSVVESTRNLNRDSPGYIQGKQSLRKARQMSGRY